MEEIVRKTKFLGNYKTIVGDGKTDIVLNTLGKVYILTGNNFKLINKLFEQLDKINLKDIEEIKKSVIINSDLENLSYPGDGVLIFNPLEEALYMSYDLRYIKLLSQSDTSGHLSVDYSEGGPLYVAKTGDTMTGPLEIVTETAPLIIASRKLVNNLNASYLNGYSSDDVAIKNREEYIYKKWSFAEDIKFDKNIKVLGNINAEQNINIKGKIGTREFIPGYLGYGWQMNTLTNMLTVDYLVVRKAMQVYELIINEVSATNGTFWVTDTCKVQDVYKLESFNSFNSDGSFNMNWADNLQVGHWYVPHIIIARKNSNTYNIPLIPTANLRDSLGNIPNTSPIFINYSYVIRIKSLKALKKLKEYSKEIDFEKPSSIKSDESLKTLIDVVSFFDKYSTDLDTNALSNKVYNLTTTPTLLSSDYKNIIDSKDLITPIYLYYKYFGIKWFGDKTSNNLRILICKNDKFPSIQEGDLIRCLKFKDNNIKYYDALVVSKLDTYQFLVIKADSVFDKYSTPTKEELNTIPYSKVELPDLHTQEDVEKNLKNNENQIISDIEGGDDLVRIGSMLDTKRQGSLYLTSSEVDAPNIKVLDGVNRPDYNVVYYTPKFKKENGKYYTQDSDGKKTYYDAPNKNCVIEENKEGKLICVPNSMVKTLVGKLDGIQDPAFPLKDSPTGYGLYGENVYLTGKFVFGNTGLDVESYIKGVENGLEIAIDEVNSGGDNLYNSALDIKTHINGYAENQTNKVLDITSNGFKVIGTQENNTYLRINTVIKNPGYYTISFKALCPNQDHSFKIIGSYMTKLKSNVDNILGEATLKSGVETDYLQYTLYVNREDFLDGTDSLIYFWFPYFNELEVIFKDVKIEKGKHRTAWSPSGFDSLLNTGINIKNKEITVTADKFKVRANNGTNYINVFKDNNGKPVIEATNLNIDNITAEFCTFNKGIYNGLFLRQPTIITNNNLKEFVKDTQDTLYELIPEKTGNLIIFLEDAENKFETDFKINLPGSKFGGIIGYEELKYVGSKILIINRTNGSIEIEIAKGVDQWQLVFKHNIASFSCDIIKNPIESVNNIAVGWKEDYLYPLNELTLLNL